jgi:hypothetical protein
VPAARFCAVTAASESSAGILAAHPEGALLELRILSDYLCDCRLDK